MEHTLLLDWADNFGVNPQDLQLNHMTAPHEEHSRLVMPSDFLQEVHPSQQY